MTVAEKWRHDEPGVLTRLTKSETRKDINRLNTLEGPIFSYFLIYNHCEVYLSIVKGLHTKKQCFCVVGLTFIYLFSVVVT